MCWGAIDCRPCTTPTPSAGGVVLDPFAGSGTTTEACLLENLRCIAVEREPDYVPLIMRRLGKYPERR